MRCNQCGKQVSKGAVFCPSCGNKLEQNAVKFFNTEWRNLLNNKMLSISILIIALLVYSITFRCNAGLCLIPSKIKGDYCLIHTCKDSGCLNKKVPSKNYCYTHSPSSTSGITYVPENADKVLEFTNINISHNSVYTVCTGTITNTGRDTYSFVEVKGKFCDKSGKVIDTDWTYAVGSEKLSPGESTTFRLSVDKDTSIKKCNIEILEYEKD